MFHKCFISQVGLEAKSSISPGFYVSSPWFEVPGPKIGSRENLEETPHYLGVFNGKTQGFLQIFPLTNRLKTVKSQCLLIESESSLVAFACPSGIAIFCGFVGQTTCKKCRSNPNVWFKMVRQSFIFAMFRYNML
jgi:hypothetical protein